MAGKIFKDLKSADDILTRARSILRRYSDQNSLISKISDPSEQTFLKVVFSFHPTRVLPENPDYPILIGACYQHPTFFVQGLTLTEEAVPDEDDAISLKKCINGIMESFNNLVKQSSEKRYEVSPFKKIGIFLPKIMSLYPFSQACIIQSVIEKLPHKNMPVENQFIFYRMTLDLARLCPD